MGEASYTWSADNSACTARRECANDASHKGTKEATVTSEVTTAATCTAVETRTYTATFENGTFETETQTKTETIPATGHSLEEHPAVAATCTQAGNGAYWSCSNCGKYFSDENGETEIEENSWVIPARHKLPLIHEDRQEPTFTEDGHIEGYTCSACGKHFRDEEGTDEISYDEWIIKKPDYQMGDINGDGVVNILDLQMLYNHVAEISLLTGEQLRRADINNNGTVNIIDLQTLFNIIAAA